MLQLTAFLPQRLVRQLEPAPPFPWDWAAVLLGRWLLAGVSGHLAIALLLVTLPLLTPYVLGLLAILIVATGAGLVLGIGQALAIRPLVGPDPQWSQTTGAGLLIGALAGVLPALQVAAGSGPAWGLAMWGGIAGLAVGLAQLPDLRRHTGQAGWWVVASSGGLATSWGLGLGHVGWEYLGSTGGGPSLGHILLAALISGLVYGGLTGPVLLWLLREQVTWEDH